MFFFFVLLMPLLSHAYIVLYVTNSTIQGNQVLDETCIQQAPSFCTPGMTGLLFPSLLYDLPKNEEVILLPLAAATTTTTGGEVAEEYEQVTSAPTPETLSPTIPTEPFASSISILINSDTYASVFPPHWTGLDVRRSTDGVDNCQDWSSNASCIFGQARISTTSTIKIPCNRQLHAICACTGGTRKPTSSPTTSQPSSAPTISAPTKSPVFPPSKTPTTTSPTTRAQSNKWRLRCTPQAFSGDLGGFSGAQTVCNGFFSSNDYNQYRTVPFLANGNKKIETYTDYGIDPLNDEIYNDANQYLGSLRSLRYRTPTPGNVPYITNRLLDCGGGSALRTQPSTGQIYEPAIYGKPYRERDYVAWSGWGPSDSSPSTKYSCNGFNSREETHSSWYQNFGTWTYVAGFDFIDTFFIDQIPMNEFSPASCARKKPLLCLVQIEAKHLTKVPLPFVVGWQLLKLKESFQTSWSGVPGDFVSGKQVREQLTTQCYKKYPQAGFVIFNNPLFIYFRQVIPFVQRSTDVTLPDYDRDLDYYHGFHRNQFLYNHARQRIASIENVLNGRLLGGELEAESGECQNLIYIPLHPDLSAKISVPKNTCYDVCNQVGYKKTCTADMDVYYSCLVQITRTEDGKITGWGV